jgi:Ner family transcriptional regulator
MDNTNWDKHAIKAEIHRQGSSLSALARDHDYQPSTLRAALFKPHTQANRIIAEFIGVPMDALWPRWFDRDGKLISRSKRPECSSKKKRDASSNRKAA